MTVVDIGDVVWIDPTVRGFYRWDEDLGESVPSFQEGEEPPIAGEVIGTGWSSIDGAHVSVEWYVLRKYPEPIGEIRTAEEMAVDPSMVLHVPSTTLPCHDPEMTPEGSSHG